MLDESIFRIFNPLLEDGWDDQTLLHPRASFFHCAKWARVLNATYGHRPHYLGVMQADRAQALLPILEVNSPFTGRRGVSVPFSDEGGLLILDEASGDRLLQKAMALGRAHRWKYLELRGHFPGNLRPTPWTSYFGYEVDLSGGLDALFARFDGSVRRAIHKAVRAGVQAHVLTTLDSTRTFYRLHCLTRRKHGTPPQSFAFFRNLLEHVIKPGNGFIVIATHEQRPVAGGVFVHHGRTAMYKFGASNQPDLHLRGNDLVMWEAIKWYASRGYSWFTMGRTAPSNEGLRRFKCGFGAREYPIDYFRYDLRRERFLTGHEEKPGWINRACGLSPLFVLQIIGRLAYRHIH